MGQMKYSGIKTRGPRSIENPGNNRDITKCQKFLHAAPANAIALTHTFSEKKAKLKHYVKGEL